MDDAWRTNRMSDHRSEADVARLVIRQTDQMIAMALEMGLEALIPTLERVKEEAQNVLAACSLRLNN